MKVSYLKDLLIIGFDDYEGLRLTTNTMFMLSL